MSTINAQTHEVFKQRWRRCREGERFVAEWLKHNRGCEYEHLEATLAEDYRDIGKHSDGGDLIVSKEKRSFHVEVKWRTVVFRPYPCTWPWETVLIEMVSKFERKDPRPDVYYILSGDKKAMIKIPVHATIADWRPVPIKDGDYKNGRVEEDWAINKHHPALEWIDTSGGNQNG